MFLITSKKCLKILRFISSQSSDAKVKGKMFVLEESQLLEDTIKNKAVLDLYKTLKRHESSSCKADWLSSLNDNLFKAICSTIIQFSEGAEQKSNRAWVKDNSPTPVNKDIFLLILKYLHAP